MPSNDQATKRNRLPFPNHRNRYEHKITFTIGGPPYYEGMGHMITYFEVFEMCSFCCFGNEDEIDIWQYLVLKYLPSLYFVNKFINIVFTFHIKYHSVFLSGLWSPGEQREQLPPLFDKVKQFETLFISWMDKHAFLKRKIFDDPYCLDYKIFDPSGSTIVGLRVSLHL